MYNEAVIGIAKSPFSAICDIESKAHVLVLFIKDGVSPNLSLDELFSLKGARRVRGRRIVGIIKNTWVGVVVCVCVLGGGGGQNSSHVM